MKTFIYHKINIEDVKEVSITAKRWFQKSYGNTYNSVMISVLVSNELATELGENEYYSIKGDLWIDLCFVPFEYGYGNHFETIAKDAFIKCLIDVPNKVKEVTTPYLRNICKEYDIAYYENVHDVPRKKDL